MKPPPAAARTAWADDALARATQDAARLGADDALAAALLATDPHGLGGAWLRAAAGPRRDAWLALLRALLPIPAPWRRVPAHATDAALLGGLDIAATLSAGRPVAQSGLLTGADGGALLLASAERVGAGVAALLGGALDRGALALQREGLAGEVPARWALIALDEAPDDEPGLPAALADRLALRPRLQPPHDLVDDADDPDAEAIDWQPGDIARARQRLATVVLPPAIADALCAAAAAWGVEGLRAPLLAVRAARALAALSAAPAVDAGHAELAARLVLAPRATRLPAPDTQDTKDTQDEPRHESQDDPPDDAPPDEPPQPDTPAPQDTTPDTAPDEPTAARALEDRLVEAVRAALPADLLAALAQAAAGPRTRAAGSAGAWQKNTPRGRPVGTRRGDPRRGQRLHLLDTLRAAAPWQTLRRRASGRDGLQVRPSDFHVQRLRQRRPSTTVFVVDASGSSALHRLAEAKGAVELLLADCYVRRDRVAVIAFRGAGAELLLPPTRSLARAKRELAGLPGGGGTPLAAGLDAARELGERLARGGDSPLLVVLTDGKANIARAGAPGRAQAADDARAAAEALRAAGLPALLIDTSPQPAETARTLAVHLGATYLPLPHAGAAGLSQAVQRLGGAGR